MLNSPVLPVPQVDLCFIHSEKGALIPLTANSLGRITKIALKKAGVPMEVFGPHSTRGAAVGMFRRLGLTAEQVAELGKWKNLEAFTKHYSRIGAVHSAQNI